MLSTLFMLNSLMLYSESLMLYAPLCHMLYSLMLYSLSIFFFNAISSSLMLYSLMLYSESLNVICSSFNGIVNCCLVAP
jgi:hypothetical protein